MSHAQDPDLCFRMLVGGAKRVLFKRPVVSWIITFELVRWKFFGFVELFVVLLDTDSPFRFQRVVEYCFDRSQQ